MLQLKTFQTARKLKNWKCIWQARPKKRPNVGQIDHQTKVSKEVKLVHPPSKLKNQKYKPIITVPKTSTKSSRIK